MKGKWGRTRGSIFRRQKAVGGRQNIGSRSRKADGSGQIAESSKFETDLLAKHSEDRQMNAIRFHSRDGPEALVYEQAPTPLTAN
jgi:hypothetical protein